jgi:drug/metabolite transporter (DMT)-like permease
MRSMAGEYSLLFLAASGLVLSQLLIKHGAKQVGAVSFTNLAHPEILLPQLLASPALIMGFCLSGLMGIVWLVIVSRLELSFAAPMLGAIYYILLMVVSAVILGERVDYSRWAGALMVAGGAALISRTS